MAFTVTPTSGEGPYTFEAQFSDVESIGHARYTASLMSSSSVGACPPVGATTPMVQAINSLIATGEYVLGASFSEDTCVTYTLNIRDNVLDTVISSANAQISNL